MESPESFTLDRRRGGNKVLEEALDVDMASLY